MTLLNLHINLASPLIPRFKDQIFQCLFFSKCYDIVAR